MLRVSAVLVVALVVTGCGDDDDPDRRTGEACTLSSECDSPLVCRLGRCRLECREARDCAAGQICLVDGDGVGSCRVPEDTCALDGDCPEPLVCGGGACVNGCAEDRDCPPDSTCQDVGDGLACQPEGGDRCTYDSDCPAPLVCNARQQCVAECREDRDCRTGEQCIESECRLPMTDGG